MKERLRASDYRFILICAALLAATTWFSVRNFYRAFPEASIDFKVSRDDARNIADTLPERPGIPPVEGYRQAAQFTYDEQAKTFLEREVGLERANRIMGTRVRLWRWAYRWFRPLQKEEYNVEITPLGQLAGFEHELPEDAARPAATTEQARALAEDFLRTRLGPRPRVARLRGGHRRRAPASRGPHLHLERARFPAGRRHQPDRSHRARQRGGRLSRVPQDPRAVEARLPAPAIQERSRRPPSIPP